jgi:hypothetical protein
MVRIKIGPKPNKNNHRKCDKSGAIADWRKEGQQKYPKGGIKCPEKHPGKGVIKTRFGCIGTG